VTPTLGFGQPLGAVVQFAYVVEDLERSIADFVDGLGVGPWFVRERFRPPAGRYRGEPTSPLFSLARAFAGHAMVELIEQHDDAPSVYHEHDGPRRYGFHHWGVMTATFEQDVARYVSLGYAEAFTDTLPSGSRVVYMDATRDLPGMIELIEHTGAQERVYTEIYEAAIDWDGREPVRTVG
jgi:glyoxalase/bleomycin resistance protein/dioxygenase superfamily protein